jgi:predicted ArsR family transcriptional regulator
VSDHWGPLEILADQMRRALYELVRRRGSAVTREDAAAEMGISRGLAAFHLDKLVDAGLLSAAYEAAEPRGRGRAPKVYRAAGQEIGFSLPSRRYDLMGEILAEAIDAAPDDARNAALRAAYRRGQAAGEAEQADGATEQADGGRLERLLERLGFEPDESLGLRNCPFHRLAVRHTELVCALNQAFLAGILHGLGATSHTADLAPAPGFCCVRIAALP